VDEEQHDDDGDGRAREHRTGCHS
ncbi:uncharacterized protein METZ01_LOCUS421293, partial [marine metagenome]